ncbi:MAG TPA: ankyrin repeat domain-containing protein [Pyrinomonadaceae bacterium]
MANLHEQLLTAIAESKMDEAKRLVQAGIDLNVPYDEGASALYPAILSGDVSLVLMMLEHGANPDFVADEPAASIYTKKPLDLAMQARFLLDWDRYHPIVKLLEEYGATDVDGQADSRDDFEGREHRAGEWQASKSARSG